tara:strand:- start:235 stop:411 length:177 start_codon:yes stop_codon:yes gene_type:complete
MSNWRVTTYDKDEEVIETFVIENRTEREAEKEAMNDVDVFDCWDWTMMEIEDEPQSNN